MHAMVITQGSPQAEIEVEQMGGGLGPHQLISFPHQSELMVKAAWAALPKGPEENTDYLISTYPLHLYVMPKI